MISESKVRKSTPETAPAPATRKPALLPVGIAVFCVCFAWQIFLVPQSFSADVSIAVQQPAAGASALAALGAQAGAKKYLGIARSREVAEQVERRVSLREFYRLPSVRRAVEFLMKSTSVEDRPNEGLFVIGVRLTGPPLLAMNASARRRQTADLAAETAYAEALRDYYVANDNERDSVLVRGAEEETRKARQAFDAARDKLRDFVRRLPRDARLIPSPDGKGPSAGEMAGLYQALTSADADIRGLEAAQANRGRRLSEQLAHLSVLPSEDPLLTEARSDVDRARTTLDSLLLQYGEESPRVILAREKLALARRRLDAQIRGFRSSLTSEQGESKTRMDALAARRSALQGKIAEAEGRLPRSHDLMAEFEALRNEPAVALEARKAAEVEAIKPRMNTVSAQSRLSVVDPAIAPERGSPGWLRIAGYSLLASLCVLGLWQSVTYLASARKQTEGRDFVLDL